GIDPEAYLRHILSVLPEWPSNRVDELNQETAFPDVRC
ncbi:transposase domain-containing protein, partial [Escherichia coli]